jgi:transcriptional regulator NrdR family protein
MICPECKADDVRVIDARPRSRDYYRRYECRSCRHRFSTSEQYISISKKLKRIKEAQFALNEALSRLLGPGQS